MRKHVLGGVVGAAVAALVLAGCGGSPSTSTASASSDKAAKHAQSVYDQINGLTGEARTKKLVAMATKEGEFNLYTSNTDIQDIVDAFSDKYDIDVNVYRANSETVLQRVLQEAKASFQGADLIETNAGELNVMQSEGLLSDYTGALRDSVRPEGQKDGWTADRFNVFVVGWNSKLVKTPPTSLEDLADPKWKGKVSMEVGDVDWFAAMIKYYESKGMSEDDAIALFDKIAKNAKIVKGHTVQGELLSAGQFGVATSIYSHTVDKAEHEGAPVEWRSGSVQPVQPVVIRPNGAALVHNAKAPAAAMLFMDFLLTDGQKLLKDVYRIGSVPGQGDPLAGLETTTPPEKELLDDAEKWDGLYEKVTDGGVATGDQ
ncbi:MAG: ABC transporter substrate-binding protein [Nocardioidaceae bacterium]|nr:ABC transporter substrate-binding protein [Nocardioidaceae bacterium]